MLLSESKKEDSICYMIRADKSTEDKLVDLQKELKLEGPELTQRGDFHNTIRYITTSKSPDLLIGFLEGSKLPILKGRIYGFDIFGPTKDTLVLRLESKEIDDWFKRFDKFSTAMDYPKSKYPTYKPHISLNLKPDIERPKWKDRYGFEVKFNIHVISGKGYKDIWVKEATKTTLRESIIEKFINSSKGEIK
jgi:hypothetical protein